MIYYTQINHCVGPIKIYGQNRVYGEDLRSLSQKIGATIIFPESLENTPFNHYMDRATVSLNYSQSIKINIGPSHSGTIVQSTHCPTVSF